MNLIIDDNNCQPARVSVGIDANIPESKYAEKYCPQKFPIHCSLTVSKSNINVIDEVREAIRSADKNELRYKKMVSNYAGATLHIFTNKADLIRPVAHTLKNEDMVISYLTGEDKITPRTLIQKAQTIINEVQIER